MTFKRGDMVLVLDHPDIMPDKRKYVGRAATVVNGPLPSLNPFAPYRPDEYYELDISPGSRAWVKILMPLNPPDEVKNEETDQEITA